MEEELTCTICKKKYPESLFVSGNCCDFCYEKIYEYEWIDEDIEEE